jgi:hypothetical protein
MQPSVWAKAVDMYIHRWIRAPAASHNCEYRIPFFESFQVKLKPGRTQNAREAQQSPFAKSF